MPNSFDRDLTEAEERWFRAAQMVEQIESAGYWRNDESDERDLVTKKIDSKITAAAKKVPLELIPLKALKGPARVFGYGKKKHGHGNFYEAHFDDGAADRYVGGFLRHLADSQEGSGKWTPESIAHLDAESGLPEIDHAICGLLMLRAIAVKSGVLPEDPGVGNEPPKP